MSEKLKKLKKLQEGSLTDRLLIMLRESKDEGIGPHELAAKLDTSVAMVRDITLHLRQKGLVVKAPIIYRLTRGGSVVVGQTVRERETRKAAADV